jgi:hypothetical protein
MIEKIILRGSREIAFSHSLGQFRKYQVVALAVMRSGSYQQANCHASRDHINSFAQRNVSASARPLTATSTGRA